MNTSAHPDAQRMAKRFHEVWQTLDRPEQKREKQNFSDLSLEYRIQLIRTFDEMLRAGLIFGGPSLYAEPSV
jgi:hypothetical protein